VAISSLKEPAAFIVREYGWHVGGLYRNDGGIRCRKPKRLASQSQGQGREFGALFEPVGNREQKRTFSGPVQGKDACSGYVLPVLKEDIVCSLTSYLYLFLP
jgi:hypothetical protein